MLNPNNNKPGAMDVTNFDGPHFRSSGLLPNEQTPTVDVIIEWVPGNANAGDLELPLHKNYSEDSLRVLLDQQRW
jgi:hypothetical protein